MLSDPEVLAAALRALTLTPGLASAKPDQVAAAHALVLVDRRNGAALRGDF